MLAILVIIPMLITASAKAVAAATNNTTAFPPSLVSSHRKDYPQPLLKHGWSSAC